ncbi:MAG: hypothetical protein ABIF10_01830 [Candidatus Woesearchaeota archaeon]
MGFFRELSEEFDGIDRQKYGHGHLYYACALITLTLFFVTIVQAVMTHLGGELGLAVLMYFIAVLLLITSRRCFARGAGHYKYPPHSMPTSHLKNKR